MVKKRTLKKENSILKNALQNKIISLNEIIKPGFNFETVTKKDNPKEYFAGLVLYKLYSLNISIENSIVANDIFLSIYLYRYIYELYIKILYIFSGSSEKEILIRLDEFFNNKKWILERIKDEIDTKIVPAEIIKDHKEKYIKICRFVHPNIDSLNLHYNRTDDQQFEFIVPNINLTIWHIAAILKLFSNLKLLNIDNNIDLKNI